MKIYLQEFNFKTGGIKKMPLKKTDNEKIKEMEMLFLQNRKKYAKQLFKTIKNCAKRFVKYEHFKRNLPWIDFEEKALDATSYIMLQYSKRPNFRLKIPTAYIRLRVLAVLFNHRKIDEITKILGDEEL